MYSVSKIALAVALSLGASTIVFTSAADAQRQQRNQQQGQATLTAADGRKFQLSREEVAAIAPVQQAIQAKDYAAANAALAAAQAGAQGADARYIVGQLQLQIGRDTENNALVSQGLQNMISSGTATEAELPRLLQVQGGLALQGGDRALAEQAFTRAVELQPNNTELLVNLAAVKSDLKKPQEAVQMLERAIQIQRAANQQVPESWTKFALRLAYENNMTADTVRLGRELVQANPTRENWRDTLVVYREVARLDPQANLDLMRLMRVNQSLSGERDYYELADTLNSAGLPGEAKAVIDDGVARRVVDANKPVFRELLQVVNRRLADDRASLANLERQALAGGDGRSALNTADALLGYGEHNKAIALYRAALQRGGVDTNVVNTRLGMALALAGQRAEAEAAFRAVSGQRSDIAAFWLLWLSQQG